jgi:hypothetical protein
MVVTLGLGLGACVSRNQPADPSPSLRPAAKNSTNVTSQAMNRADFRNAVLGKTAEQVIQSVGRPDSTQEFGDGPTWYYEGRTYDPVTGKKDSRAQVVFNLDRIVVRVNY